MKNRVALSNRVWCVWTLCANQIETLTSPPGIPGEFACLVFEEGGNLTFFSSGRWGICLGVGNLNFFLNTCAESKMASMTMDEFKCEEINFVLSWLQENGFERLKRVSEGKKNFVIPKLRNAVASNSYMGWGIWTPIFHKYVVYLNGNYNYM